MTFFQERYFHSLLTPFWFDLCESIEVNNSLYTVYSNAGFEKHVSSFTSQTLYTSFDINSFHAHVYPVTRCIWNWDIKEVTMYIHYNFGTTVVIAVATFLGMNKYSDNLTEVEDHWKAIQ